MPVTSFKAGSYNLAIVLLYLPQTCLGYLVFEYSTTGAGVNWQAININQVD